MAIRELMWRRAAMPFDAYSQAGAPGLFAALSDLDRQRELYLHRAQSAADQIGQTLVPVLENRERGLALRVRRALHRGKTATPITQLAELAEPIDSDLAWQLHDLAAAGQMIESIERLLTQATAAEENRLLALPWELLHSHPAGRDALTKSEVYRDVTDRLTAGESWTTKRMRKRSGYLWRLFRRMTTHATIASEHASTHSEHMTYLAGQALRVIALTNMDAEIIHDDTFGQVSNWPICRDPASRYGRFTRWLERQLTNDVVNIDAATLDAFDAPEPAADGLLDVVLRNSLAAWPNRSYVPRITVGNGLTITPAQWRVSDADLPDPNDSPLGKARVMNRMRQRMRMPRWVTVTTDPQAEPIPVDLESLLALRFVRRSTQPLLIAELLPPGESGHLAELRLRMNSGGWALAHPSTAAVYPPVVSPRSGSIRHV